MNTGYLFVFSIVLASTMDYVLSQRNQSICADIVFALETSCSVDNETKQLAKLLIHDFVSMFDSMKQQNVSKAGTQFGMLAYDAVSRHVFTFEETLSKQDILRKIETFKIETIDCKTLTHKAIHMASIDFFESPANDERTPDVLVILTDGRTQPQKYIQETTIVIQKLREAVRTLVIELPNKKGRESLQETIEQLHTLADAKDRFKLDNKTDIKKLAMEVFDHLLEKSEFVCKREHICHEKCPYKPPPPNGPQPGRRRFSRITAMLDCTYEDNCDIQFLKDFAADLDRQPKCKLYYPLKEVAVNRLFIIYGCESAGYLQKAMLTKDSRFKCHVQLVMDYLDFATLTLGMTQSPETIEATRTIASLKCEPLIALFREINYPPNMSFDEVMAAWRGHALGAFLARQSPTGRRVEAFHYVGEEKEVIFGIWDNPEQMDRFFVGAYGYEFQLQKKMVSGLKHRARSLIHLDCMCNPDRDMYI